MGIEQDGPMYADGKLSAERDSLKDEAVVFIFIIATAGLLLWALVKSYVQKWLVVCATLLMSLTRTQPALILVSKYALTNSHGRPHKTDVLMNRYLVRREVVVLL